MNSERLADIDGRLRSAARLRNLDGVPELLMEYRAEFDRLWSAMSDEERRRSPMRRQALALNAWMKAMVLAFRAEMITTLRGAQAAGRYARGGCQSRPRPGFTA